MAGRKRKTAEEAYRDALTMIAPGSRLREAISAILQAGSGALLCIGEPNRLARLSEGGVKLDAPATPQLLYELCKMDGAIILNGDATRLIYANRFLRPSAHTPSNETGTRHRTGQRMANQAKCIVIALSERRASVTLYVHDQRHVMDSIPALINRAMQAVQTLEKYISVLNSAMTELTLREFQDIVTIFDVCRAVQRLEMVSRIGKEIDPYLLELGTEGRLIRLQLRELLLPISDSKLVVRDYYKEKQGVTAADVEAKIAELPQDELLEHGSICQVLGHGNIQRSIDTYLTPRGYRVLKSTHRFPTQVIENLVRRFGSLQNIIRAPKDELCNVEGVGEVLAERVRVSLSLLRNQLALDDRR